MEQQEREIRAAIRVGQAERIPKRRLQKTIARERAKNPTAPEWVLVRRVAKALGRTEPEIRARVLAVLASGS